MSTSMAARIFLLVPLLTNIVSASSCQFQRFQLQFSTSLAPWKGSYAKYDASKSLSHVITHSSHGSFFVLDRKTGLLSATGADGNSVLQVDEAAAGPAMFTSDTDPRWFSGDLDPAFCKIKSNSLMCITGEKSAPLTFFVNGPDKNDDNQPNILKSVVLSGFSAANSSSETPLFATGLQVKNLTCGILPYTPPPTNLTSPSDKIPLGRTAGGASCRYQSFEIQTVLPAPEEADATVLNWSLVGTEVFVGSNSMTNGTQPLIVTLDTQDGVLWCQRMLFYITPANLPQRLNNGGPETTGILSFGSPYENRHSPYCQLTNNGNLICQQGTAVVFYLLEFAPDPENFPPGVVDYPALASLADTYYGNSNPLLATILVTPSTCVDDPTPFRNPSRYTAPPGFL